MSSKNDKIYTANIKLAEASLHLPPDGQQAALNDSSCSPQEFSCPAAYSNGKNIVDLFEEQAQKTPHSLAIVFIDAQLTYEELNERANRVAHYLRAKGVNEQSLVPICMERSLSIIPCILGILKAGAAYVPIDPEYPEDRINYILADTGAKIVISNKQSCSKLQASPGIEIIAVEDDWSSFQDELPTNFSRDLQPHHLAYVIYTSGSTGRPKGVMIEHANILNYLLNRKTNYINENSNCSGSFVHLSYTFDASLTAIFMPLLSGKSVIVGSMQGVDAFHDHNLQKYAPYDFIKITPAHLELLRHTVNDSSGNWLTKKLVIGGEALHLRHLDHLIEKGISVQVINEYGPTEATVGCSTFSFEIPGNNEQLKSNISIGKPIDNVQLYIVNELNELLSVGAVGELWIGGSGVARGYLNRADLTAERFIQNPFTNQPAEKIYKTGDLAKWLPDGNIAYAGRKDDQVKINGYRIELGEIECILQQCDQVHQGVVLAKEDKGEIKKLVGYIVPKEGFDKPQLIDFLSKKLPAYMIPSMWVELKSLPLTINGKVDRKGLGYPKAGQLTGKPFAAARNEVEENLVAIWQELLGIEKIGIDDSFFELGGNSLLAVKSVDDLKRQYHYNFPITTLYQHPTIRGIANYFNNDEKKKVKVNHQKDDNDDIAVIGMAGRFPGADTIEELWEVLKEGKETIRFFRDEELDYSIPQTTKSDPCYVKARGIVNDADNFDAAFFGINPKLAALMDPQQRIFLEIAWEVLEQTGHLPDKYDGTIGVFAGTGNNTYYLNNVLSNKELINKAGPFQVMTLNEKDYISTRVAFHLNLKGPAVSLYSACSTSLLAIAQAAESIRNGKCQVALAGGASIHAPIHSGQYYEEGAMFSPDGRCKPFDKNAKGTVFSDGAGVVLLKGLKEAIRDNDTIYAVLKGVGYNNDGSGKASFTAPSAEGQAGAIVQAINDAGIESSTISYIETHGTATPLGDPIEIEGLKLAFGSQERTQFCAIGSIKSNMGHLTAAAGVAGFIKTTLSLYNKQIPASLHYKEPNPNIQFDNSPFFVNAGFKNWDSHQTRRAGVSSFGVGGTNVHVVLEEFANTSKKSANAKPFTLVTWSAKTEKSIEAYSQDLNKYLSKNPTPNIADIAYTLQTTRSSFNLRRFIIAADQNELSEELANSSKTARPMKLEERVDEIAFLFPGQGSQYQNMGLDLYLHEPVFKNAIDECADILQVEMNEDIRKILYPPGSIAEKNSLLNNTRYTQPALFIIEYAMAKLWINWGIKPSVVAGHSIGEFVAGTLAGIFSLKDALKLVASRSSMMGKIAPGKMLSVQSTERELQLILPGDLQIAAINSSKSCVVSGHSENIERFASELKNKGIASRVLNTSHAFHSSMMNEIVEPFRNIIQAVRLNIPTMPIVSTVTGNWMSDAEATNPVYWANQLAATVRFADALDTLQQDQKRIMLEVGPGNVTSTLARQQLRAKSVIAIGGISRDNKNQSEYYSVLDSLGKLWLHGIEPDWNSFYVSQQRNKITLPTYSFDKKRCWVEPFQPEEMPLQTIISQNILPITEEEALPQKSFMRKQNLISEIKQILEDASGIEVKTMATDTHFMEMGLDSLSLTQISLLLKKQYKLPITFRQLMENYDTVESLSTYIDAHLPKEEYQPVVVTKTPSKTIRQEPVYPNHTTPNNNSVIDLISQQIQLLAKQVTLMQGGSVADNIPIRTIQDNAEPVLSPEEEIEIKKPFGASARIQKHSVTVNETQQKFIEYFIQRYIIKTKNSKAYTQKYRASMADPRVVSGFQPLIKEMIYPIVVNKSKGSRLWDIDGNEYIDVLNGFGSNLLGHQHDSIKKAIQLQLENGYEIGPQHHLAGEVCELICEFTNFDRTALCNTGSEAVLGAMRIARTVTGRSLIVSFNGSYHGIVDEVIVRGTKKLKTFPAAAGIMPEAVQNMLVLDYGTDESLQIIRERAHELAAILVEPVQGRRAEFVPIAFLKELRQITEASGTALIFDEVITGFRMHPGGVQALFNIKADIGTYGKVVAGGMPIGVIAGKKKFMDALDGGFWQYGDDSAPEVGVTYFAGTFVRHPLALAATKASLEYMKIKGPSLQENISAKTKRLADSLNNICEQYELPLTISRFGSLWKCKFKTDIPYGETLFSLLRYKGIHIWDLFPCFITEAHTENDIDTIIEKFRESVTELIDAKIFPSNQKNDQIVKHKVQEEAPVSGAKLGRDEGGNPAWFITDPDRPGKFLQIVFNEN